MAAPKGGTPWNAQDLTGQRFGRLTVVESAGKIKDRTLWLCRCDCGGEARVITANLKRGNTCSCGCLQAERAREAGRRSSKYGSPSAQTPEYRVWSSMIQRCHNPTSQAYRNYGARGITVCDRWRSSFEDFRSDMGPRPSERHSLDRIDNNSDYRPDNCRWATPTEQLRNTRSNHMLTFNGMTLPIVEWSERTGIKRTTIDERLKRGWSVAQALTAPVARCPA